MEPPPLPRRSTEVQLGTGPTATNVDCVTGCVGRILSTGSECERNNLLDLG